MAFSNIKDDAFYWTLWDLSEAALEWVWSGRYWRLGPNIFPIQSWALAHDDDGDDDDDDDDNDDDDDGDGRYWRLGLRPNIFQSRPLALPGRPFLAKRLQSTFHQSRGMLPSLDKQTL